VAPVLSGKLRPVPYIASAAAGLAAALLLATWDPVQRVEWSMYDWSMRLASRHVDTAPDVIVVAIDEPSFAEIGRPWPWPRALHAKLVDELARAGAMTIAFDIVFDVETTPDNDRAFAAAVRRAGNVIVGVDRAVVEDSRYALTQWSEPFAALAEAAAGGGVVRIPYDPDATLRRVELSVDGRPTLAAAVAARDPRAKFPDDRDTPRLFRFDGPSRRGIETVSYYQALDAEHLLPRGIFRGRHVLVGRSLQAAASLEGQEDLFKTPVAIRMAGVEVHATVVDALLRSRWVADPFASRGLLILFCIVTAAVGAALTFAVGPLESIATVVACVLLLAAIAYASLAQWNVRLPILIPALALLLPHLATSGYRFAVTSRERRMIKHAFQHYVAPAIVERMLADPSQLRLGGEEYDLTVLFSDIEGFTTLSEKLTPQQLRDRLSGYFKDMLDGLLAERGTLDKLIGDAIMVYFGCPIADADHPMQACRGALAMQRRMVELNARWAAEGLPQVRTRIGINTGRAVAGNMGTDTIFNFTILGDCVNLASRLEGVNKEYGTLVIIGEDTRERIGNAFEVRELDWIRVKGKLKPVAIYELVAEAGLIDDRQREVFAKYADGLAKYRLGLWQDASAAFSAALAIDPSDRPSAGFVERCADLAAHTPRAWDGVHVMTKK
jgi:adenylate cyclase